MERVVYNTGNSQAEEEEEEAEEALLRLLASYCWEVATTFSGIFELSNYDVCT